MSRDAPIKERSDVLEGVGGFARGFDALDGRGNVRMSYLVQRLRPFEMASQSSLELVQRAGL